MPFSDREIPWIFIAYCTKQIDRCDEAGFVIEDSGELAVCGLFEPTLVTPAQIKGLPWSPSFFMRRQRDNIGPIIGRAPEAIRRRVLQLMPQF
ncbi:MAG: hypothetical protein QE484_09010 [Rhizobium sp.]|nr:hypothetical protein [Rhizobium sp.]